MTLELFLNNLLAWSMQLFVLATLGAVLPLLFRLRHPRTHLAYCHALLAACLLLPLIEPWQHPVVAIPQDSEVSALVISPVKGVPEFVPAAKASHTAATSNLPSTTASLPGGYTLVFHWNVRAMILFILLAGFAARMGWLLIGLWRIRAYRIGATPLYPIPETIQAAAAITHANALFCVSPDVGGPVTLGWLAPAVLLPESFTGLSEEAQCAVACHELLHVRRHDWLVTLLEESTGALLWFNPAIWMLLSQTRLVREQLVDAEVVRLTSAREPYIDALMAIARGRQVLDLTPAPLFLRRRHLTQRMHALLKEVSMSKLRLFSSYGSMTAVLGVAAWFAPGPFPLVGGPQYQASPALARGAVLESAAPQPRLVAQAQSPSRPGTIRPVDARRVTVPITPADVNEPVTGIAQATVEPADRASALFLLERAKQVSKLHMPDTPPFALKVTFQAWGDIAYTGYGELTENWRNGQDWRWSAKLGNYSNSQFGAGGRILATSATLETPLRVQMLRNAIFWAVRQTPSSADIRTAAVQWNGKPATCVLFAPNLAPIGSTGVPDGGRDVPAGRRWNDEEYCFDPATGLLQVYSFVPGSYVVYGYAKNRQFHGRAEPDQITLFSGGAKVMDAQLDVTDLGDVDPNAAGAGSAASGNVPAISLALPSRIPILTTAGASQVQGGNAIIHATLDPAGRLIEAEVVTATDSATGQRALNSIKSGAYPALGPIAGRQGNALQREMYFDVRSE